VNPLGKELDLANEQTAQRLYSRELEARAQRPRYVEGLANDRWLEGVAASRVMTDGQLIGRVALMSPDPDLDGSDFYIGETYATIDGIRVFSWAAPVACTFFRGTRHHEWCDEVAAIRAFVLRNGQIIDFAEEAVRHDAPAACFRKRGLSVPAPPARFRFLPRPKRPSGPAALSERGPEPVAPTRPALVETGYKAGSLPAVRAEALLRAQLQAPRMKSLAPVLGTLQPDQYDLVTAPAMTSVIIEGQPGTGKTIIASHRAAYLINYDTPRDHTLDGNILLVGPTAGYSDHVRDVVNRLTGGTDRITIRALPQLMQEILGLRQEPSGPSSRTWQDVDAYIGELATAAVHQLKAVKDPAQTPEKAYEALRRNMVPGRILTRDPEWLTYLSQLPPYKDARVLRAYTPLLALIKWEWEVTKPSGLDSIEHIIVDEAQDVTPLEWLLLKAINETTTWTLLGDLNQRRSDHTLADWQQVLEVLELECTDAPIRKLQRGYRSTKPIMEYANRLLPSRERVLLAFQTEGPAPSVTHVPAKGLDAAIFYQLERLLDVHPAGTVAVISADPAAVKKLLRSVGWGGVGAQWTWARNDRSIMVLHPDAARGLEFDAVIVVEPSDFPQNHERQGPLYTALTRPNRELAIVHTKPLPRALRHK
jgi:DNA helicase II / ATP-dependent DNA helicase PcrA